MLKLGAQNISTLYVGGQKITKAYLGSGLVFDSAPIPAVYTVTVSIDPAGSGTVTGAGQYQEGESVTVRAVAADGYTFAKWQINGQDVGTGDSYTFTVTGDVEITAVFGKSSRLPAGYTELEYIQSSGTQYINTGYKPYRTDIIEMDVEPLTTGTSSKKYFFYSQVTVSSNIAFCNMHWDNYGVRANIGLWASTRYTTYIVSNNKTARRMYIKLDLPGQKAYCDSVSVSTTYATTMPNNMSDLNLLTTNGSASFCISAKLYSCKIHSNETTLVRDFVPCTNPSGAVGLYDLLGKTFYANAGTGVFTAGPAV